MNGERASQMWGVEGLGPDTLRPGPRLSTSGAYTPWVVTTNGTPRRAQTLPTTMFPQSHPPWRTTTSAPRIHADARRGNRNAPRPEWSSATTSTSSGGSLPLIAASVRTITSTPDRASASHHPRAAVCGPRFRARGSAAGSGSLASLHRSLPSSPGELAGPVFGPSDDCGHQLFVAAQPLGWGERRPTDARGVRQETLRIDQRLPQREPCAAPRRARAGHSEPLFPPDVSDVLAEWKRWNRSSSGISSNRPSRASSASRMWSLLKWGTWSFVRARASERMTP